MAARDDKLSEVARVIVRNDWPGIDTVGIALLLRTDTMKLFLLHLPKKLHKTTVNVYVTSGRSRCDGIGVGGLIQYCGLSRNATSADELTSLLIPAPPPPSDTLANIVTERETLVQGRPPLPNEADISSTKLSHCRSRAGPEMTTTGYVELNALSSVANGTAAST